MVLVLLLVMEMELELIVVMLDLVMVPLRRAEVKPGFALRKTRVHATSPGPCDQFGVKL